MKKLLHYLDDHGWALLGVFFVLSVIFLLFASPYTTPLNGYYGYDSAVFMVLGRGTAEGGLPYLDFYDNKGPMIYYIDALGWLLGGRNGIFLLQCVFMAFAFTLTYAIARLYVSRGFAWISVGILAFVYCGTVGEGNMTEEWSLVFTLLPMYLSLSFLKDRKKIRYHSYLNSLIYGLCLGVQLLFRVTNAFPLCGMLLAFAILLIQEKSWSALFLNIVVVLTGAGIIVLPFMMYFKVIDAFDYFIYASLLHNFSYATGGAEAKTLTDWAYMAARILMTPVTVVLSILFVKKNRLSRRAALVVCCVSITGAIAMCFGYSYKHYFLLLAPAIAVSFSLCVHGVHAVERTKRAKGWLCAALAAVCLLPYAPQCAIHAGKSILFNFAGYLDNEKAAYEELNAYITEDRDSVWAYELGANTYMYLDVLPCFRHFTSQEWMSRDSAFIADEIDDMLENDPPVWILASGNEETQAKFTEEYNYELVAATDYGGSPALYHLK